MATKNWFSATQKDSVNDTDKILVYDGTDSRIIEVSLIKGSANLTEVNEEIRVINGRLENITSRVESIENNGSGGGSTGGSLNLRDVLDGEIFTIETNDEPTNPTETYGQIVVSKSNITITEGGTDSFTVNLDKAPTNNQIITLSKDNSDVTLSTYSLTFTPSNYSIAQTVTIAVAEDDTDYSNETCNITLTSPNVTSKSLLVNIIDNDTAPDNIPVSGVSLDVTNYNLKVGETVQLTYTVSPDNATNKSVTWSTNNSNCTVVEGLVTAETEGDCIITCTTVDGNHMATCNITVASNGGTEVVTINNLLENSDTFETSTVGGMKWQKYNIDFQVIEAGHCKVTGNKEGANGLFKYSITADSITDIPNNTTHIFFSKYEKSTDGITYDIRATKYGTITSATTFVGETGIAYGSSVWVKNAILIDLTEEYGSGNEPSQEECITRYLNVWNA